MTQVIRIDQWLREKFERVALRLLSRMSSEQLKRAGRDLAEARRDGQLKDE